MGTIVRPGSSPSNGSSGNKGPPAQADTASSTHAARPVVRSDVEHRWIICIRERFEKVRRQRKAAYFVAQPVAFHEKASSAVSLLRRITHRYGSSLSCAISSALRFGPPGGKCATTEWGSRGLSTALVIGSTSVRQVQRTVTGLLQSLRPG